MIVLGIKMVYFVIKNKCELIIIQTSLYHFTKIESKHKNYLLDKYIFPCLIKFVYMLIIEKIKDCKPM